MQIEIDKINIIKNKTSLQQCSVDRIQIDLYQRVNDK